MRKKVEKLERRNQEVNKKIEKSKVLNGVSSQQYQSNLHELDKMTRQEDQWKAIRKHPVTKALMIVSVTVGLIYVSSFAFNVATKAAISYKRFKKVLED
jgi:hypothetical protein|tara:strand:+ start:841 stop:1137 length:297 start_codon:yes stop_codon:yes gene_type:complete